MRVYRTLVAALPRDYAATADPYLGHTVGPITGYGVSRSSLTYYITTITITCHCCVAEGQISRRLGRRRRIKSTVKQASDRTSDSDIVTHNKYKTLKMEIDDNDLSDLDYMNPFKY